TRADHLLFDLTKGKPRWKRGTNSSEPDSEIVEDGVLHVTTAMLNGWDTIVTAVDHPFAAGETLTCFRAKGGLNTPQICVEWAEKDDSRWIATVNVTPEWQNYALPPSA